MMYVKHRIPCVTIRSFILENVTSIKWRYPRTNFELLPLQERHTCGYASNVVNGNGGVAFEGGGVSVREKKRRRPAIMANITATIKLAVVPT